MPPVTYHLIPHTHWDREWYLTRAEFHARLVPMLDDLVARLAADAQIASFVLDGQTVHLSDYLRVRPDQESALRSLVASGRLQIGPWYILADELIPSGEALVRNLLAGRADAERLGGRMDVLYSPDAFGHPAILPTLARGFGIRHGVAWRGLGGEPGEEGDLYRWVGPDGGSIVLYHLPPEGYEVGAALPARMKSLAKVWPPIRDRLNQRAASRHVAVFVGADHHALHPDLPRLRDLLAEAEPAGDVRISRLIDFLTAAAADRPSLPKLSEELRWSYRYTWTLQGVHGTRLPFKRRNSAAELRLERGAEPLAALAARAGGSDRRPLLDVAWRALLECQFHDVLAGSASDDVIGAAEVRLGEVEAFTRGIARASAAELLRHDPDAARERPADVSPRLVLWNPAARRRRGIVVADVTFFRRDLLLGSPDGRVARQGEGAQPFALATAGGRAIPVQVLERRAGVERLEAARHYPDQDEVDIVRAAFRPPSLSGLGFATFGLRSPARRAIRPAGRTALTETGGDVRIAGRSLGNRLVQVRIGMNGSLTLIDRHSGERFDGALRLELGGDIGDTYSYCPPPGDQVTKSDAVVSVRRVARGALIGSLEAAWMLRGGRAQGGRSRGRIAVRMAVELHAESPIVRVAIVLDNRATDFRLRSRIATQLVGTSVVAGAPFGSVIRHAELRASSGYRLERPVTTAPAHRFIAAARRRRGLALLTPGFAEYEWTSEGDLIVTLLRGVGHLSRGDLSTRPGHAAWLTPTPLAQCPGRHSVELGLVTVSERELRRGDVVPRHWEDAFLPISTTWLRDAVALRPPIGGIALEGTGLVMSAVKPGARDGAGASAGSLVLRCYNATDRETRGRWRISPPATSARRVRTDERIPKPLALDQRGSTIPFVAAAREIVTIVID